MKKKFIVLGLIIGSIVFVGCMGDSKEVAFDNDVKEKSSKGIEVVEIKGEKDIDLLFYEYQNSEAYGINVSDREKEGFKKDNITGIYYEEDMYKIGDNNKLEKSDRKVKSTVLEGQEKMLIPDRTEDLELLKGFFYIKDGKRVDIRTFKEPLQVEKSNIMTDFVQGNENYGYYKITRNEKNNLKVNRCEVINLENGQVLKLEDKFKEGEFRLFYRENFYIIDNNLKLYKLKKDQDVLKISETVDLAREFSIKEDYNKSILGIKILNNELEILLEIENKENRKNMCVKYNLNTGEKIRKDTEILNKYRVKLWNLKEGVVILEEEEGRYFLASLNDKIEILGEIKVSGTITNFILSRDKKEAIINYIVEKEVGEVEKNYIKVKIKNGNL